MDNLIERYIYDVTRRLPEKERDEVAKELRSNIYDMLPDGAGPDEIRQVLLSLGAPAALAEKYRQNPRYLISPAVYEDYVRALKWIIPLVAGVAFAAGAITGIIGGLKEGVSDIVSMIAGVLSQAISLAVSAGFHAAIWTTFGFVIAERTGARAADKSEGGWRVEDLPEIPSEDRGAIPLSDSVAELVIITVFSFAAILLCSGLLPIAFMIEDNGTRIMNFFTPGFLQSCIPVIIIIALMGIFESALKIKYRRWTPVLCAVAVVGSLVNMALIIGLINRPDIFTAEYLAFMRGIDWPIPELSRIFGASGGKPVITLISAIVVVSSLAECVGAVYKTFRNRLRAQ